jgi:thioredoxin 1
MQEFKDFKTKNKVCIVDAFATWCPPCVRIAPKYESMSGEFTGKCAFGKFDVDNA